MKRLLSHRYFNQGTARALVALGAGGSLVLAGCRSTTPVVQLPPPPVHPTVQQAAAMGSGRERVELDLVHSSARSEEAVIISSTAAQNPNRPQGPAASSPLPAPEVIAPGVLAVDHRATIGSDMDGRVSAVLVREGDRVQRGQPLILLDDRTLRLQVDAARTAVEAAERRLKGGSAATLVAANEVQGDVVRAEEAEDAAIHQRDAARAALQTAVEQSSGQIAAAEADRDAAAVRLERLKKGNRPEEIAEARAAADAAEAQLARAADDDDRMNALYSQAAVSRQSVVDADKEKQRLAAALASAQQQLALLQEGARPEDIAEAEAEEKAAEAQLEVARSSARHLDELRADLASAQSQVQSLAASLTLARESHVKVEKSQEDSRSLSADVASAEAALAVAESQLSEATIRSPMNGQVIRRLVQPGDSVSTDHSDLLEIVDPTELHVDFTVTEEQLSEAVVGKGVRLGLPAYPGMTFRGAITRLDLAPQTGSIGYTGRIRIDSLPSGARAGMLVSVLLNPTHT